MRGFLGDLRYAGRTLGRTPGWTAAAALALALGLAGNATVFTLLNGILLQPLPFEQADRLVHLSEASTTGSRRPSLATVREWQSGTRALAACGIEWRDAILSGDREPLRLTLGRVTPGFFDVLRAKPVLGSLPGREQRLLVLTDGLWSSRYGRDPRILGRTLRLDDSAYTVVAVLPASFRFFQRVDAFTVLDPGADARVFAFGRLRDGVSAAQAQDEMRVFAVQEWAPRVEDLQAYLVRGPRADLPVLMTAAALVLLIACANVAGLVLARAAGRKRELAIRTALGAGRLRLVRQLLAESLLLAGLAGALGFALAAWVATVVRAQLPPEVLPNPERLVVDGRVLAFTLALSVITSLLFGLAPALRASAEALRSGTGPGRDTARLRRTLAGAEVAAAVVLVSGTLLIGRALSSASDGGPLADPASVLTTRLALPQYRYSTPERIAAFHGGVVSRAQADPAIAAVALATSLRYRGDGSRLEFTVGSDESPRSAARSAVTGSYFGLMGIALRRGRLLADGDRGIAVINEAFARSFLHEREPVGSQLRAGGELIEIVGIVRDEHASGPAGPSPLVYVPFWEKPPAECSLLARGPNDDRAATAAALRTAINSADRDLPIAEVATIAELRDRALAVPRVLAGIMGAFGGLALLLALIGTYGLVSFTVAQRVSEMGLRIALGAGRGDIARLVLREAALLGGLGAATGAAGSIVIALALRSRLFGVPPQHPGTALAVALAVMLTTIAAAALPARRAAGVDPVVALRQE